MQRKKKKLTDSDLEELSYWQKRNLKAQERITDKKIEEIDKQLLKYYSDSQKKVIADFEATYEKILNTVAEGTTPTPADLYKLDKYWQMQGQLKNELQMLGDKQAALLSKKFTEEFLEVYESLNLPSKTTYYTIDRATAQQMINNIWVADGKSWSARIWANTEKLAETLNEELINCVISGRKTTDLKYMLMERFKVSYSAANGLVNTEIAHIQTQAAQKRYEDYGIEQFEVWADPDERRCDKCGKLHKTKYYINEAVPIPAHTNCRCCIIPVID